MSEATEVKTITIDDKKYAIDSLTEKGQSIILNLQKVEATLASSQFDVTVAQLAKAKLLDELGKEVQNFTEVTE